MARLFSELTDEQIDRFPILDATVDDLEMAKVEAHITRAIDAARIQARADQLLDFLKRYRGVVDQDGVIRPTVAGLLMFGSDPQAFMPHAIVGLAHFPGVAPDTTDVLHLGRYGGTLPDQIDSVFRYLWTNIRHGFSLQDGAQRTERPEYPRVALRELTVNALAHRDYNDDGRYTRVSMFMEHLEWISPGGLPGGITVENILQAQYSRNPNIAEFLYQAGYIERFGLGLDLVARELRAAGLPALSMRDSEGAFTVTMYGPDAPAVRAQTPFRLALLTYARQHGQLTMADVRRINDEQSEYRSQRSLAYDLSILVQAGFLRRIGKSRDTAYVPVVSEVALETTDFQE